MWESSANIGNPLRKKRKLFLGLSNKACCQAFFCLKLKLNAAGLPANPVVRGANGGLLCARVLANEMSVKKLGSEAQERQRHEVSLLPGFFCLKQD